MVTNVRSYIDRQILDKVRACPSFRGFPAGFWLVGVRSNEDAFNRFDDKFYCFKGEQFIAAWKGTTNAGTDMLNPTNPRGEAVLKSGDIYYDSHERRKHRGKVMAYCQRRTLPLHRDNDRDRQTEESGTARDEIVGINIHPASYQAGSRAEREAIQGWSQGCQVFAIRADFDDFMRRTEGQHLLTYALLTEWNASGDTETKPEPRTLKIGDEGDDVRALQAALKLPDPDGIFGRNTRAAVIRFQADRNMRPDGIVGKQTRHELGI
jgi:hypothetical protein